MARNRSSLSLKDKLTSCHIINKMSIVLNSYNIQCVWRASLSVFDQNIEN